MAVQTAISFALFDTAIGRCAIAWSERGIVSVLLPGRDDAALRARLRWRHPDDIFERDPKLAKTLFSSAVCEAAIGGEHLIDAARRSAYEPSAT